MHRPEGYAQIFAGVVPTQRPLNRQYAAQAAYCNYAPPSLNPFDRVTDLDVPHTSYSDLGGHAVNAEWDVGRGTLTAITAWRYWLWGRNILDEEYFELLTAGGASSGYCAGLPGDPRTYGVTLRGSF